MRHWSDAFRRKEKKFFGGLLLSLAAAAQGSAEADAAQAWGREDSLRWVQQLNVEANGTCRFALNKFQDVSPETFRRRVLLPSRPAPRMGREEREAQRERREAPAWWDWRDKGVVSSVKDQKQFGTCWAFSAVGAVEGAWALAGHELVDLSVEQLVECDASYDASATPSHADCGEFGGWPYLALEDIRNNGGLRSDADMPYCIGIPFGKEGNCLPCMAPGYSVEGCGSHSDLYCKPETTLGQGPSAYCAKRGGKVAAIAGWRAIAADEALMAEELVTSGPLSVAMDALSLQFYRSGVYDPKRCNPDALNHAVLLVGFGTDEDSGKDYWLVKNSWGDDWGEDGFFRIARGKGACGIHLAVVAADAEASATAEAEFEAVA